MNLFKNISFQKLKDGLTKTRETLANKISEVITGKAVIDDDVIDNLEDILITSDIGFSTSEKIIQNVREALVTEKDRSGEKIKSLLKMELLKILQENEFKENNTGTERPHIHLIIGVNGSGKTTSIGKLAYNFKLSGASIMIASADTFRAAANEQLEIWAQKSGIPVSKVNAKDPSAVVFETLTAAKNRNIDVVLIDTAGRLHTQKNLMDELNKIKNIIKKVAPNSKLDCYLVIDGNTGQNAVYQVEQFLKYTEITGLILTKLDGTAKGGVVFQICSEMKIPIKYIGVGEGIEDLQTFEPVSFVNAILN